MPALIQKDLKFTGVCMWGGGGRGMGERQKDNKEKQNNINLKKKKATQEHEYYNEARNEVNFLKNDNHENPQSLWFVSDILEAIQKRGM